LVNLIISSGTARRVNIRSFPCIGQRLYTTAPKKFSKWTLVKNGVQFGVVAAIAYGGYGKLHCSKKKRVHEY
jgi:hypothetical protein